MAKKKPHKNCACLFCSSVCPECGSPDIRVSYKPAYQFDNDTENVIRISSMGAYVVIECNECGKTFDSENISDRERTRPLLHALAFALSLPASHVQHIDDDMKIKAVNSIATGKVYKKKDLGRKGRGQP